MNEWRNVAQAAYALSQAGPLCWHATPTFAAVAATALTTERTSNIDVSRGSRSSVGG